MVAKKENLKVKCMRKGCEKNIYLGARGLCINHFSCLSFQVKTGKKTWEEIEKEGLSRPVINPKRLK